MLSLLRFSVNHNRYYIIFGQKKFVDSLFEILWKHVMSLTFDISDHNIVRFCKLSRFSKILVGPGFPTLQISGYNSNRIWFFRNSSWNFSKKKELCIIVLLQNNNKRCFKFSDWHFSSISSEQGWYETGSYILFQRFASQTWLTMDFIFWWNV